MLPDNVNWVAGSFAVGELQKQHIEQANPLVFSQLDDTGSVVSLPGSGL